jgi:hypothetical protein
MNQDAIEEAHSQLRDPPGCTDAQHQLHQLVKVINKELVTAEIRYTNKKAHCQYLHAQASRSVAYVALIDTWHKHKPTLFYSFWRNTITQLLYNGRGKLQNGSMQPTISDVTANMSNLASPTSCVFTPQKYM